MSSTQDALTGIGTEIGAAMRVGMVVAGNKAQTPIGDGMVLTNADLVPFVVVPEGSTVQSLKGQILPHFPTRRRATVELFDAQSFIDYVTLYRNPHTRVFADVATRKVMAVLDYHEGGEHGAARWGQHRASLTLRHTPEWNTWLAQDRKRTSQTQFAEFIEDNLGDIAVPDGSTILQVSKSLEATKSVKFATGIRLDNGQTELSYNESIDGGARVNNERVTIPQTFVLGLVPFEGSDKFEVTARLRYRIVDGGKLEIGYDLMQPARVVETAFTDTLATIHTGLVNLTLLRGTAPAAVTEA